MRIQHPLCILSLVYACTACGEDAIIEVGQIEAGPSAPMRIQVPESANVGESVPVGLVTYGDGCISFEETDVSITDDGAEITPYDRRRDGGRCPLILLEFNHDTTVSFGTPGAKLIRINGRRTGSVAGERFDEVVQFDFTIDVH